MPEAPVTANVHQALDVHGCLGAKRTLDFVISFDLTTKSVHIVVVEVLGTAIRVDTTRVDDLFRAGRTDPVYVRKGDLDPLTARKIYASDACHLIPLLYPWRCLCFGFREQMMRTTPFRRTTLQCSQIGLTLLRTFTSLAPIRLLQSLEV